MEKFMKKFTVNNSPKKKFISSQFSTCNRQTFGIPLSDIIERDKTEIPVVVLDIFDFLLKHGGIEAEGIFRVNGNSRTVEALRHSMNEHGAEWRISDLSNIFLASERSVDVFSVASLLKLFLRELPGGLVPAVLTSAFVEAYKLYLIDKPAGLLHVEKLLSRLPVSNYALLQRLCQFLSKILCCQIRNKMSTEAFGIVFGPNVFRLNPNCENLHDQSVVNRIMTMLVENQQHLFRTSGPPVTNTTRKNGPSFEPSGDYPPEFPPDTINECLRPTDSNSSGTDSASQSTTTLGFNNDAGHESTWSLPILKDMRSSQHACTVKPASSKENDFSAGLATAIRVCIEEHLFGVVPRMDKLDLLSSEVPQIEVSSNYAVQRTDSIWSPRSDFQSGSDEQLLVGLSQRLHDLRVRLRDYEDQFEGAWGHKPSMMEKRADVKISELMDDLYKIRARIKQIKSGSTLNRLIPSESDRPKVSVHESAHSDATKRSDEPSSFVTYTTTTASCSKITERGESADTLCVKSSTFSETTQWCSSPENVDQNTKLRNKSLSSESQAWTTTNGAMSFGDTRSTLPLRTVVESPVPLYPKSNNLSRVSEQSLSDTYAVLLHRLAEKRFSANRPEDLNEMTPKQIEEEKLALQKALLCFENLHGRPKGHQERLLMRPLYDRYRRVKRLLNAIQQKSGPAPGTPSSGSYSVKTFGYDNRGPISSEQDLCPGDDSDINPSFSGYCTGSHAADRFDAHIRSLPQHVSKHNSQQSPQRGPPLLCMHSKETAECHVCAKTPVCPENNFVEGRISPLHKASATLPAPTRWVLRQSGVPPESGILSTRRHFQVPNEEWFGSFGAGSNACVADVNDGDLPSTKRSVPMSTTINVVDQTGVLPGHHTSETERNPQTTSPARPRSAFCTNRSDHSIPEQSLVHNQYALSSSTEKPCSQPISTTGSRSPLKSTMPELSTTQLEIELRNVRESKRHLQKTLKDFEHEFQKATGHKLERSDRLCMRAEYNQYKVLKTRLSQLESELALRIS